MKHQQSILFVVLLLSQVQWPPSCHAAEAQSPADKTTTAPQVETTVKPQTTEAKVSPPADSKATQKNASPSSTEIGHTPGSTSVPETKTEAVKAKSDPEKSEAKKVARPPIRVEKSGLDIIAGPWFDELTAGQDQAAMDLLKVKIHLKFGLVEFGNVNEFVISRQLLDRIGDERSRNKPSVTATSPTWIDFLEQETDRLVQSARATLFGEYPLIRGFELPFEENDEDFRVYAYTRRGDAKRNAVRNTLEKLGRLASLDPQHVLILIPSSASHPTSHEELARLANSESQAAFARFPNLKVYGGRFRDSVDAMPAWEAADPAFDPICRKFLKQIRPGDEPRSVMIVQLRDFEDDNLHWVQAQYRLFGPSALDKAATDASKLEADKIRIAETLTRDFSPYNYGIWILIGVLYVIALVTQELLTNSRTRASSARWVTWFALPSLGFILGIFLTHPVMMALADWLPKPRTSAWSGTWWPCVAGSISLILPLGVFRLAAGSADRYWPTLSYHGRWGIAFLPVALGITAAWVQPAFYANGWKSLAFIPAFAAAAASLAYCFGRAIDRADKFPVTVAPISMLLTVLFGAAAFLGSASFLWLISIFALLAIFGHGGFAPRASAALSQAQQEPVSTMPVNSQPPVTLEELRKSLAFPIYRGPKKIENMYRRLLSSDPPVVKWIGLIGPKASGKTAALRFLQEELKASQPVIQILSGVCTHRSQRESAYQPFRDAFTMLGLPEGLVEAHTGSDNVNSLFDNLAYELIPFWTFFSFDSESGNEKSTRTELIVAVTNALRKLSQTEPVVLVIDDIQWIDEDSAALLSHLWTTFPPGSEGQFTVILAGRDLAPLGDINPTIETVTLSLPSELDQIRVLTSSLNIEPISAKQIVTALGVMGQEPGGMYWVLRALRELVDDSSLSPTPRGFVLSQKLLQSGQLPVPLKMRDRMIASLHASGDSLRILECAALLGSRFRVSDVADCLGIDRLDLLETLRRLDRDSQLVRDVPLDEECYEFSSSFLHEVLREELGVSRSRSRKQSGPSKIAREMHGRIAEMMKKRSPRPKQATYAIAEHFFEAGEAYHSQCIEACHVAVEVARKTGDEPTVQRFTSMIDTVRARSREATTRAQTHAIRPISENVILSGHDVASEIR